jgi:hypothetical protein
MGAPLGRLHRVRRPRGRASSAFRFRLEDRDEAAIHLPKGYSTVGRSRACDVVLPFGDVQLRHAALLVNERGVVIERLVPGADLAVNGVPVQRAALVPTDEVALAAVRLRLEHEPREPRPRPTVEAPARPAPAATPSAAHGDWVEVLERLHDWSRGGALDKRGAMLGLLVEAFALRGAALLQRRGRTGLAAVNAWGQVADLLRDPRVESALKQALREDATLAVADEQLGIIASGRDNSALALAVLCPASAEPLLWPLRLAFRFLAHEYFRDQFRGEPIPGPPVPEALAFPPSMAICRSPAIVRVYDEVRRVAGQRLPVVLIGETGTGKGELAHLLHLSSPQAQAALQTLDCAAPPELLDRKLASLLESSERGRQAGGTLLVDDLTALGVAQQARLIALLDALAARPGEDRTLAPRVVAILAEEPEAAMAKGTLRRDLYYRLAGFEIRVPPLRQRTEDVPQLFDQFLGAELGPRRPALSPEALEALMAHAWPGNLRELRFEAARVAARAAGPVIALDDLSTTVRSGRAERDETATAAGSLNLDEHFRNVERQVVQRALGESRYRLSHAAELLGISRGRLRRRMRELGIAGARGED